MLRNCPICKYSLDGLPDEHVCPECGFKYERESLCFTQKTNWISAIVTTVLSIGSAYLSLSSGVLTGFLFFGVITIAVIGIFIYQIVRSKSEFVLVSRHTLAVFGREERPEVFPMKQIESAIWSQKDNAVLVYAKDGTELTRISRREYSDSIIEAVPFINEQTKTPTESWCVLSPKSVLPFNHLNENNYKRSELHDCPVCEYSFDGLPDKHFCPECGLEYERNSVYLRRKPRQTFVSFAFCVASVLVILIALSIIDKLYYFVTVAIPPVLVMVYYLTRTKTKSANIVIISKRSLTIAGRKDAPEIFGVDQIASATYNRVSGTVRVKGKSGEELTRISQEHLGSRMKSQYLVLFINKLIRTNSTLNR